MILNGKIEAEIGGKKRLFVFNNNVFIRFAELYGDDDLGYFSKLFKKNFLKLYRNVFHLALIEGGEDIDLEKVGRLISEMEIEEFNKVVDCMVDAFSWGKEENAKEDKKKGSQ